MHIKEIIIDGFKSYATRTVVSGFDKHFNAITGPNGSGKSNILDAIVFVLGINNLSQVRASDLQGLVYKKGQAGITKASVTLVFDNEDKRNSPAGYEHNAEITVTRQVVINGRNKYLINGHNAQQARVHNLFHSVGLNVNKPHFLIMQGLITKVVKMKPQEILGMIEEAAGTAMFEVKRTNAIKTIEKKQRKVDEINQIITEEIAPTLEKLRGEQKNYNQWVSNSHDIERLSRFVIAYQYWKTTRILESSEQEISENRSAIERINEAIAEHAVEQATIAEHIEKLMKRKSEEMEDEFKGLDKEVSEMSKKLVKLTSEFSHHEEQIATEESRAADLASSIAETQKAIESSVAERAEMEESTAQLQEEADNASEQLKEIQDYQLTGVSTGGQGQSYNDQLMAAKQALSATQGEIKQATVQVAHLEKEHKRMQKELKSATSDSQGAAKDLSACQKRIATLEAKLAKITYSEAEDGRLSSLAMEQKRSIRVLRDQVDELSAKLSNFSFDYSRPSRDFRDTSVKGLVANLIAVHDADRNAAAIEVVAGGRLYNVVIDTESTGKALLKGGKLRRRVTFIPLSKIKANPINRQIVQRAKEIVGADNVDLALSLVGYDDELQAAMEYVFGGSLVCPNLEIANALTFHKDIRKRTVTLDGDVCDPQGTMTGGSSGKTRPVLRQLHQLNEAREKLHHAEQELADTEQALASLKLARGEWQKADKELASAMHQQELLNQRMQQSEYHQLSQRAQSTSEEIATLKASLKELASREKVEGKTLAELEANAKDAKAQKKQEEKTQKKRLSDAKKRASEAVKALKEHKNRIDSLGLEIQQMESECKATSQQIEQLQETLNSMRAEHQDMEATVASFSDEYDSKKADLDAHKAILKATDKEISTMSKRRDRLVKEEQQMRLELQKSEHKINRLESDLVDAQDAVKHIAAKHSWVEKEKQSFGTRGSDYDFEAENPKKAAKTLATLEAAQEKLSKSINRKVMNMFQQADQEYRELCKKREIIQTDRAHIEKFIEDLDEKKNEALQITWEKVTRDFNSIFSTLLPGWSCKLIPPEGMELKDGLEVKFARDNVWKDSLSELSGGQRSLLALSLILSMLLFKPAPVYILDEVDSALDLSNTQNIGQMLKAHFPQAQFVVVSLKEGMWNNANVLFKTKFVDGVSTVSRIAKKRQAA
eukprot:TRINITY_DN25529_c0_g1_i1.p1 TRINITY_DN25529_c0_g1~~TRINITY_DN25529_c0_g1_i1.p1  ORF type:complete len:1204 (+),score=388.83 TRINITY_DN25529_c0_g1_i1:89-3613(+)